VTKSRDCSNKINVSSAMVNLERQFTQLYLKWIFKLQEKNKGTKCSNRHINNETSDLEPRFNIEKNGKATL